MDHYMPHDVTPAAHAISQRFGAASIDLLTFGSLRCAEPLSELSCLRICAQAPTLFHNPSHTTGASFCQNRTRPRTVVSLHSRPPAPGQHGSDLRVKTRGMQTIQLDGEELDLSAVEQLVEASQTRAIADALLRVRRGLAGPWRGKSLAQLCDLLEAEMDRLGLDALTASG